MPVALHPSSVNAKEGKFESRYLVYAEKVRTGQVYVRDSSPVSPYALMLFGGGLDREGGRGAKANGRGLTPRGAAAADGEAAVLVVDTWIKFRVPQRIVELILDVRERLHELLRRKIERPALELSASGQALLGAVSGLLGTPPPE